MNIVCIPGLGYDRRIFGDLALEEFNIIYLDWLEPQRNESIRDYATRMSFPLHKLTGNTVLVGHSFGGLIAQEIALTQDVAEVILLSSIVSQKEIPAWLRAVKTLGIYKLPIQNWSSKTVSLWGHYHGFDSDKKRKLFKSMVNKFSPYYFNWALNELVNWEGITLSESVHRIQVHGEKDRTFPFKRIQNPDYIIKNGNHIFMFDHQEITTGIIKKEAQQYM